MFFRYVLKYQFLLSLLYSVSKSFFIQFLSISKDSSLFKVFSIWEAVGEYWEDSNFLNFEYNDLLTIGVILFNSLKSKFTIKLSTEYIDDYPLYSIWGYFILADLFLLALFFLTWVL